MIYQNRLQAGRQLAKFLSRYQEHDILVLALPRGGVEVGYEVAEALDAELDVLVVRKIGAPQNPEFGLGAIASYGAKYINEHALRTLDVPPQAIQAVEEKQREELERREIAFRDDLPPPQVEGRIVILVDDGLATGGSARAAIQAVRSLRPAQIVLAVPVAPRETVATLQPYVAELICPEIPRNFRAIGQWYEDFEQVSDQCVLDLLRQRRIHLSEHQA